MSLDLSDLESWDDTDVIKALTDIEEGLSKNDIEWIDRFAKQLETKGYISPRQREVAESILRKWNRG